MKKFKNNVGAGPVSARSSKERHNKGITLIALVITIIVMLILVAVTISMVVNGGLFDYAGKATGETQNAINEEQALASGRIEVDGSWYASIDDYLNNKPEPTAIYAKLYDDGTLILSSTDYTDTTRTVSEDYGDVSTLTDYNISNTAPYSIQGNYPGWMGQMLYTLNTTVTNVIIKDKIVPQKIEGWFSFKNVEKLDLTNIDTRLITSMNYVFFGCASLTDLNISNWDTSNVTSMKFMFGGGGPHSGVNLTNLDMNNFDTSKVTDMSHIFENCKSLTSLNLTGLNTDNVTDMSYMFWSCNSLIRLDLTGLNTDKVVDMREMFQNCMSLTSLDLTNFNTQNVTNYRNMFFLTNVQVFIGPNWNSAMTESATGYSGTFQTKQ